MNAKTKNIALWVLAILTAAVMIFAGIGKLMATQEIKDNFVKFGYPLWFLTFLGTVEVLGGLGLLIPRTRFWAAVGLIPIMIGAIRTHFSTNDAGHAPLPAALLVLLIITAIARRGEWRRIFASGGLFTGI